ncbi:hypothetical protein CKN63_12415 [Carnobacterium divergens]|uniref:hypothetical protein n=1 Tax=Carnobacterium divergens TaxID=2748 RepID=UPI0010719EB0|nr:hypothetical protein [Carnobacterium divergens]TFI61425.1 hypothetical protein CKN59_12840 [Carnobacterium divergens]TFI61703.1 hypothetical protein CKN76_12455 [Carnobacterium divergens]TFI77002.1 hypothetical protein CKN74_13070 [Carnobacterium divergens]TFI93087.1 hypothetical protein CKN61_03315 [Carnobacterium divergens]TFJ00117.1 hypothetical protein CKN75_13500 [Carnobacterium divergens]
MLSIPEKWKLYISSYLPLYFLILVKEYKQVFNSLKNIKNLNISDIPAYSVLLILIYSIYLLAKIFFSKPTKTYSIEGEFEPVSDSIMSYVMTYIVPVISVDFSEPITLVTNILLFLFIGIIYVKNDLIYLNPVISVSHNIYINGKNIVISKYSLGELRRFKKEKIKVKGKKLSTHVFLYQKRK